MPKRCESLPPDVPFLVYDGDIRITNLAVPASQTCALKLCADAPEGTKPFVFVDGNMTPPGLSSVDAECVVGGDGLEYCIAAASIIAKVTRDRMMVSTRKGKSDNLLRRDAIGGLARRLIWASCCCRFVSFTRGSPRSEIPFGSLMNLLLLTRPKMAMCRKLCP